MTIDGRGPHFRKNVGVMEEESAGAMRIGRVASELKMRRRRLDAHQRSPDWPGKEWTAGDTVGDEARLESPGAAAVSQLSSGTRTPDRRR